MTAAQRLFYIQSLTPLYELVQTSGVFSDSKFFVDCTPKQTPGAILASYSEACTQPGFQLMDFLEAHFLFPDPPDTGYQSAGKPLLQHLQDLWQVLRRLPESQHIEGMPSTLISLPHPYMVPGGRFREVYYWDSYFTLLGLKDAGQTEAIQDMVDNFAYLLDTFGFVPNGNRTYYLSRSQPPFFALMVQLLADIKGDTILLKYRHQLEKEYSFWMSGENKIELQEAYRRVVSLGDGHVLNRYWDDDPTPRPEAYLEDLHVAQQSDRAAEDIYRNLRAAAESGWDFSSRWLADGARLETIQTTHLIPVDLNCLLYFLEKTLLHIYRMLPDRVPVDVFKERARLRKNAIQQYCWNSDSGFYFDYNHVQQQPSDVWTLAAVYPLYCNVATHEQAALIARQLEEKFLKPGGLSTTLCTTGQQWDAPNGWAPLQWLAYQGLLKYGYHELAENIRQRWVSINEKTYAATGKMMEKYNVINTELPAGGGEYPNQDGFGWTNGVFINFESAR
jgi:alpha,alpha-trehalase